MTRKKKNANSPTPENPRGGYVEVGRDHLVERLALLKTVLVRRASRQDLATVHFDVKPGGAATVAATDLENALQLKLDVLHATGVGRVMIDAHALEAMLGAYSEPRVRIHLDDPITVRVEGLQTKLKLPGSDPAKEMKLTAPGSLTTAGWVVRADVLVSAIRRTRFASDKDGGTRYAMGGLALHFPAEGDVLEVIGCDGRRLSIVRVPVRAHGENPARTWKPVKKGAQPNEGIPIVLLKPTAALLKIAMAAGETSVGLAVLPGDPIDLAKDTFKSGRLQAVTRDAVLTAKLPEGRFPHWREVLPSDLVVAEFTLDDASRLGDLLATATAATDSEHEGVDLTMAGGCVMIESGSETKGKSMVSMTELEMTGKGTVALDGLMFRQFFDVIGSSPVRVKFHGAKVPLVCHAGPDHDYVQMPLSTDRPAPKPAPTPVPAVPPQAPEPAVPVGATPEAHKDNGEAQPKPRGKAKASPRRDVT